MNLCCSCHLDFGSVAAFDAHRVGKHAYTYREGLYLDPPVEDGRRCLDEAEMLAAKDKRGEAIYTKNSRGAISLTASINAASAAFSVEPLSEQDADEGDLDTA